MLTEEVIPHDLIEVLEDGTLQVREATVILRDGERDPNIPPVYHRYVLLPGAPLPKEESRVTAVANAVWTDEVVAAHAAKMADAALT